MMNLENIPDDFRITVTQLNAVATFLTDSERESIPLKLFLDLLSDEELSEQQKVAKPTEPSAKEEILNRPIAEWARIHDISDRARRAMQRLNILTVRDLVNYTEIDLLSVKNCGKTSVNTIKNALAKDGLSLKKT